MIVPAEIQQQAREAGVSDIKGQRLSQKITSHLHQKYHRQICSTLRPPFKVFFFAGFMIIIQLTEELSFVLQVLPVNKLSISE